MERGQEGQIVAREWGNVGGSYAASILSPFPDILVTVI